MSASAERALRENREATFPLQITSMVDMFTIILIFLLKSYGASSVDITPSKTLSLPSSTTQTAPVEALKLMVTKDGIYVDDKVIVQIQDGVVPKTALDPQDAKFIKPLFDALNAQAEKSKTIAKKNETVQFDGKLIFQGDKDLNYQTLRKVMYTASIAGYGDVKFAVFSAR